MKRFLSIIIALLCTLTFAQAEPLRDDGRIRVALTSFQDPGRLALALSGDYAVNGDAGFQLRSGAAFELSAVGEDVWLCLGGLSLKLGPRVTLTRMDEGGLSIGKSNLYQGDLTVKNLDGGLRPILNINLEDYLKGVVAYEMSDSFPLEALKAQAVAARTYALSRKSLAGGRDYDVTDTTADQVFKGFNPDYARVIQAVDATRGMAGVSGGRYASCYYTASNGGQVARPRDVWGGEDGGAELRDDPYDVENPLSLVNAATFRSDLSDCKALRDRVLAALNAQGKDGFERVLSITPIHPVPEDSRRYTELMLEVALRGDSPENNVTLPPEDTQPAKVVLSVFEDVKDGLKLGLNFRNYELIAAKQDGETFTLEMRRFGHGAGMSQRGAQWMAAQYGMSWREILSFYYPEMTVEKLEPPKPGPQLLRVRLNGPDSSLNLRAQPSTDAPVLAALASGQRVIVHDQQSGWAHVHTAQGEGYVKAEFLKTD